MLSRTPAADVRACDRDARPAARTGAGGRAIWPWAILVSLACVAGGALAQGLASAPASAALPASALRTVPAAPSAADTPTGLPYGDPRAAGRTAVDAGPGGRPAAIGAPDWSIAFHYGADPPLDTLRAFDTVVVDPDHVADPTVHARRSRGGSELFAYVSIGEIHPTRTYATDAPPGLFVGRNPTWGSLIVDQSHPEWPRFFVDRMLAPLWERGYRGVFLDTMDAWLAVAPDGASRAAQQDGLVRAIEAAALRLPAMRLIVNRGFEVLPRIAPHVSAVAAESLFRGWNAAAGRFEDVGDADRSWLLAQLESVRGALGKPVIAIDYLPPGRRDAMRENALRIAGLGIVPYVTDPALSTVGTGAIEVVPRRILVLHDLPPGQDPETSDAHRYLSTPLHWLGYRVELWNIRERPAPAGPLADRYAGVVALFDGNTAGRGWDLPGWVRGAREQGLRIAFVNGFGATLESGLGALLGLSAVGGRAEGPLSVHRRDPIVGHEIEPAPTRSALQPIVLRNPVQRLLQLADARGTVYDAAAIADWGGFVLAPFAVVDLPGRAQQRWVVEPVEFLRRALALAPMPAPDTTTESGRRLLMAHVDGDGFASRAELAGTPFAAEVMLRDFVSRYPIPHTVGVIQGETASAGLYPGLSPALEGIARRLFAQPNVEPASHSLSHPFDWRAAVSGDPAPRNALALPGYAFDLDAEIAGSVRYIDTRLLPAGRRTGVFLWTGDCAPPGIAIARAWTEGLLAMNGGDTTITRSNPSLTAVAPLSIRREGWLQVLAPNQNENVYTRLWTGPFWGYERVIETFEMTGRPRRIKPVSIYYHTYSAGKPASIAALRRVYDWAMAQPLHPVTGAEYIRKVVDFEGFVVARDLRRPGAWKLVGDGELRTVRLPASIAPTIDWMRSEGVAGVRDGPEGPDDPNGRYLHLAAPIAWLVPATAPVAAPGAPVVVEANGRIDRLQRGPQALSFRFAPHVAGVLVMAHAPACSVSIDGRNVHGRPASLTDPLQSGQHAKRYATAPLGGTAGVMVSVSCPP
jgi:uncharacterized protein (TIGR01370 family)